MAILIDENTQVVVQGITGREGKMRTEVMKEYGSKVIAGVTPGKEGQEVFGIPVFNTVELAKANYPQINASAVFAPPRAAKLAVFEAIDAGIRVIGLFAERIPQQDILEVIAYARQNSSIVIGPNSPGLVSPGKCLLGMLGGTTEVARKFFKPGPAGVLSRSGGNTATICYYLNQAGVGQSTAIGTGGDAFVGASWCDLLPLFEEDEETKLVAAYGEIGTTIEEDTAELILSGRFTKPMVVYIAGRYARKGVRFGHAGAMITGSSGTTEGKKEALKKAGVMVVEHFSEIGKVARKILEG